MRNRKSFHQAAALSLTAVLAASAQAQGDCESPDMPTMPDGRSASMEDMLAGQKAVKTFQSDNMDYMKCLEAEFTAAKAAVEDDGSDKAAMETYSNAVEAYNSAVSAEEEVAGQFNVELREYKAANK